MIHVPAGVEKNIRDAAEPDFLVLWVYIAKSSSKSNSEGALQVVPGEGGACQTPTSQNCRDSNLNHTSENQISLNHLIYPITIGLLFGILCLFAGFSFTGLIIAFIITFYLVCKNPPYAFAFLFLLAPYEFYGILGKFTITSNEVIILAIFLVYIFRCLTGEKINLRLLLIFLPFLVIQILSLIGAVDIGDGLKQMIRWLTFFIVFYMAFHSFKKVEDFTKACSFMVCGAVPIALYGVYQSMVGFGGFLSELIPMTQEEMKLNMLFGTFIRAHSILVQANHLGAYLVIVIPIAFIAKYNWKNENTNSTAIINSSHFMKHFEKIVIALFLLALVLTMSRSAWLALALASFIVYLLTCIFKKSGLEKRALSRPWMKITALLLIIAFSILLLILIPQIKQRFASLTDLREDLASKKRVSFYKVGMDIIRDYPIFGVGIGNYASISDKYAPKGIDPIGIKIHLHNLYLQIAVETGLLGLLSFFLFLVFSFLYIARGYILSDSIQSRVIKFALIASLAFLIQNMADIFFVKGIHFLWAGITGGIMGISKTSEEG